MPSSYEQYLYDNVYTQLYRNTILRRNFVLMSKMTNMYSHI